MTKRFIIMKPKYPTDCCFVEDTLRNTTKAVFYDEACEELAKDFCQHLNKVVKARKKK